MSGEGLWRAITDLVVRREAIRRAALKLLRWIGARLGTAVLLIAGEASGAAADALHGVGVRPAERNDRRPDRPKRRRGSC